jgi:hypothetical protein
MIGMRRAGAAAAVARPFSLRALLLLLTLLLALGASTSSCSKDPESLVGTWSSDQEGETLEFDSDGTLYFTTSSGKVDTLQWQADDSNLAIGVVGGGTKTFGYSVDGAVLTLTYPDVEPAKYTRIELEGD